MSYVNLRNMRMCKSMWNNLNKLKRKLIKKQSTMRKLM